MGQRGEVCAAAAAAAAAAGVTGGVEGRASSGRAQQQEGQQHQKEAVEGRRSNGAVRGIEAAAAPVVCEEELQVKPNFETEQQQRRSVTRSIVEERQQLHNIGGRRVTHAEQLQGDDHILSPAAASASAAASACAASGPESVATSGRARVIWGAAGAGAAAATAERHVGVCAEGSSAQQQRGRTRQTQRQQQNAAGRDCSSGGWELFACRSREEKKAMLLLDVLQQQEVIPEACSSDSSDEIETFTKRRGGVCRPSGAGQRWRLSPLRGAAAAGGAESRGTTSRLAAVVCRSSARPAAAATKKKAVVAQDGDTAEGRGGWKCAAAAARARPVRWPPSIIVATSSCRRPTDTVVAEVERAAAALPAATDMSSREQQDEACMQESASVRARETTTGEKKATAGPQEDLLRESGAAPLASLTAGDATPSSSPPEAASSTLEGSSKSHNSNIAPSSSSGLSSSTAFSSRRSGLPAASSTSGSDDDDANDGTAARKARRGRTHSSGHTASGDASSDSRRRPGDRLEEAGGVSEKRKSAAEGSGEKGEPLPAQGLSVRSDGGEETAIRGRRSSRGGGSGISGCESSIVEIESTGKKDGRTWLQRLFERVNVLRVFTFVNRVRRQVGNRFFLLLLSVFVLVRGVLYGLSHRALLPYLKGLHQGAGTYQSIDALGTVIWGMMGMVGALSDSVPLGGYQKRYYMLLANVLGVCGVSLLAFTPAEVASRNVWVVGLGTFLLCTQVSTLVLMCSGKYSELMEKQPEMKSDVVTFVFTCWMAGNLVGTSIVGPVSDAVGPKPLYYLAVPLAAQSLLPILAGCLPEKKQPFRIMSSRLWKNKRFFAMAAAVGVAATGVVILTILETRGSIASGSEAAGQPAGDATLAAGSGEDGGGSVLMVVYCLLASVCLVALCLCCLPGPLARCNLYLFLWGLLNVSISGALDFFYTAKPSCLPDGPHFDYTYYATLISVVGTFASWAGIWVFHSFLSDWTFRQAFWLTIAVRCVASLFDYVMVMRFNVKVLGIPDKFMYLFGDAIIMHLVNTLNHMPGYILTSRLCPKGLESTAYAVMDGMSHIGWNFSKHLGVFATKLAGISTVERPDKACNFDNLGTLTIVTQFALPLLAIPLSFFLLPNQTMSKRFEDRKAESKDNGASTQEKSEETGPAGKFSLEVEEEEKEEEVGERDGPEGRRHPRAASGDATEGQTVASGEEEDGSQPSCGTTRAARRGRGSGGEEKDREEKEENRAEGRGRGDKVAAVADGEQAGEEKTRGRHHWGLTVTGEEGEDGVVGGLLLLTQKAAEKKEEEGGDADSEGRETEEVTGKTRDGKGRRRAWKQRPREGRWTRRGGGGRSGERSSSSVVVVSEGSGMLANGSCTAGLHAEEEKTSSGAPRQKTAAAGTQQQEADTGEAGRKPGAGHRQERREETSRKGAEEEGSAGAAGQHAEQKRATSGHQTTAAGEDSAEAAVPAATAATTTTAATAAAAAVGTAKGGECRTASGGEEPEAKTRENCEAAAGEEAGVPTATGDAAVAGRVAPDVFLSPSGSGGDTESTSRERSSRSSSSLPKGACAAVLQSLPRSPLRSPSVLSCHSLSSLSKSTAAETTGSHGQHAAARYPAAAAASPLFHHQQQYKAVPPNEDLRWSAVRDTAAVARSEQGAGRCDSEEEEEEATVWQEDAAAAAAAVAAAGKIPRTSLASREMAFPPSQTAAHHAAARTAGRGSEGDDGVAGATTAGTGASFLAAGAAVRQQRRHDGGQTPCDFPPADAAAPDVTLFGPLQRQVQQQQLPPWGAWRSVTEEKEDKRHTHKRYFLRWPRSQQLQPRQSTALCETFCGGRRWRRAQLQDAQQQLREPQQPQAAASCIVPCAGWEAAGDSPPQDPEAAVRVNGGVAATAGGAKGDMSEATAAKGGRREGAATGGERGTSSLSWDAVRSAAQELLQRPRLGLLRSSRSRSEEAASGSRDAAAAAAGREYLPGSEDPKAVEAERLHASSLQREEESRWWQETHESRRSGRRRKRRRRRKRNSSRAAAAATEKDEEEENFVFAAERGIDGEQPLVELAVAFPRGIALVAAAPQQDPSDSTGSSSGNAGCCSADSCSSSDDLQSLRSTRSRRGFVCSSRRPNAVLEEGDSSDASVWDR